MNRQTATQTHQEVGAAPPLAGRILQRKCDCGQHTVAGGSCSSCRENRSTLQRATQRSNLKPQNSNGVPPGVHEVLNSTGQSLDASTRAFFEPRFGLNFGQVQVHTDSRAAESARAQNALAYTVGNDIVFGRNQYSPTASTGRRLLAHELAHVVQQSGSAAGSYERGSETASESNADAMSEAALAGQRVGVVQRSSLQIRRRAAPYIKKVTVHLTPPQGADLEWEGTPPADATGSDHFTVSTGKGFSNPEDPAGTCTRTCCTDPMTQCAPPWNQPGRVGACCTYYGNSFWTGTPLVEHNSWKWWTPIQPYYSSRGIALHQHTEVTGEPIGHGCVRMDEPNAKRIFDYSNRSRTNVTIDGRAAPVLCDRSCSQTGSLNQGGSDRLAMEPPAPVPGLEGAMS